MTQKRHAAPQGAAGSVDGGERRGAGWSGAYLVTSRVSAVAAVPVLVDQLGVDLYAVWVLATTFVFSQGLLDFGCAAAVVRFVALGKVEESRGVVLAVVARGALFYALLSFAAAALWIGAPGLVRSLPYIAAGEIQAAETILRYIALVFVATNVTLVAGATLQGLGRVDLSYRAKTAAAATYLPMLVIALQLLDPPHAVGASLLGMYAVEILLAGWILLPELARTGDRGGDPPALREMLSVGVRWQVSSWADFATFQLPRIVAAFGGSSQATLVVDLALRYGQAITTPLFAFYPVVLPVATRAWVAEGRQGVGRLVRRYLDRSATVVLIGAALAVPLTAATIEVWSGVSLSSAQAAAATVIALGMVAYASTGLFSSALLAVDALADVVRYKAAQLVFAVVLLVAASALGALAVGIALTVALAVPAVWFVIRAAALLQIALDRVAATAWRAAVVLCVLSACALALHGRVEAWALLGVGGAIVLCSAVLARDRLLAILRPVSATRQ